MKRVTLDWLKKAEGDFKVAAREFKTEGAVLDAVCFHGHQCVEKYLKAILVENDVEFEKIHDLEVLLNSCKKFVPSLEDKRGDLIRLTQFSVRVRYPGFEATKSDAKKALSISTISRKVIRKYFSLAV